VTVVTVQHFSSINVSKKRVASLSGYVCMCWFWKEGREYSKKPRIIVTNPGNNEAALGSGLAYRSLHCGHPSLYSKGWVENILFFCWHNLNSRCLYGFTRTNNLSYSDRTAMLASNQHVVLILRQLSSLCILIYVQYNPVITTSVCTTPRL
jgi:hypothetical protein